VVVTVNKPLPTNWSDREKAYSELSDSLVQVVILQEEVDILQEEVDILQEEAECRRKKRIP
jgi:hypothetical protein